MEFKEFGEKGREKILLIPGSMMCWRQFENVIPFLAKKYHVIAMSTDGFDGTGRTTFTTADKSAEGIAEYIKNELDGNIRLVFGESFGCASSAALFNNKQVQVDSMILNGAQCMDFGVLSKAIMRLIPRNQYRFIGKLEKAYNKGKMPLMLKLFTHTNENNMMAMFEKMPPNISFETLNNCMKEAGRLYNDMEKYSPDPCAKVSVWYGAKEPNMKKAVRKLKTIYPNAEDHPFKGLGHGEIIAHPKYMAREMIRFIENES